MRGSVFRKEPPALVNNISVETIFGQIRYLEAIAFKLQSKGIYFASDLVGLTAEEFYKYVGRITEHNKRRIQDRMAELGLQFCGAVSSSPIIIVAKQ